MRVDQVTDRSSDTALAVCHDGRDTLHSNCYAHNRELSIHPIIILERLRSADKTDQIDIIFFCNVSYARPDLVGVTSISESADQ